MPWNEQQILVLDVIRFCKENELRWQLYSGRGMHGKKCVGITVDSVGEIWALAKDLAAEGLKLDPPYQDNMGKKIILYWPADLRVEEAALAAEIQRREREGWPPGEDEDAGDLATTVNKEFKL